MKLFFLLSGLSILLLSNSECSNKKTASGMYKGRLEIKGICYNYTIQLLEGKIDSSIITSAWTNPESGKSYTNVFGLKAPCSFPPDIREGETFGFMIDSGSTPPCVVCNAYYPTPPRSLQIKVLSK